MKSTGDLVFPDHNLKYINTSNFGYTPAGYYDADFVDYTVIGDSVNLASRLESLNKVYGTHIIVSEYTAKNIRDRFQLRKLDTVKVLGKGAPVSIFELMALKEGCDPGLPALAAVFESGIRNYRQKNWSSALKCFQEALAINPSDRPSRIYIDRVERFIESPPPDDWKGVTVYENK
jgi:adenylate cyclase